MQVLAIPGSLRGASLNRRLLIAAAQMSLDGVDFELFADLKSVPPYDQDDDLDLAPAPVERLRAAIAGADALLIATPEYNSSIPGVLKNAVDWASRPLTTSVLRNKPVAVIGASTGAFGAVWSQAELRKVLGATGARVLDIELAVAHADKHFDRDGQPDDELLEQVGEVVDELLSALRPRIVAAASP